MHCWSVLPPFAVKSLVVAVPCFLAPSNTFLQAFQSLALVTPRVTLVVMIRSFRDKSTARLWAREHVRGFGPDVHDQGYKRLLRLDAAETLDDLRAVRGNRLKPLHREREGQHSIRINDQWRICFVWTDAGPEDVEITDYH
jgi:proteic killer suppression protein